MTDETPRDEDLDEIENEEAQAELEDSSEEFDPDDMSPEQAIHALQSEVDSLRDRLLRAAAETENTRKRAARDIQDTREYAITGFARDMLDIADNLNRAVAAVGEEARNEAPEALKTLIEGVEMTERRLLSALERHGVKKIDPNPGDPLDPNVHQAAAQIPADQPKGRIAEVMQPGYVIGKRTLRAAMVVVSAGPAEGSAPESGSVDVEA